MPKPPLNTEPVTLEQYNQELLKAEAEFKAGDYISSAKMLQLIRQWSEEL